MSLISLINDKSIIQLMTEVESEVTCGQIWCSILGMCALHLIHPSAHTNTHHEHTWNSKYHLKILLNIGFIIIHSGFNDCLLAFPDSYLSSAAVAGIVVAVVLLVAAAVTVGVIYCRRRSHTAVPQSVSITYS